MGLHIVSQGIRKNSEQVTAVLCRLLQLYRRLLDVVVFHCRRAFALCVSVYHCIIQTNRSILAHAWTANRLRSQRLRGHFSKDISDLGFGVVGLEHLGLSV